VAYLVARKNILAARRSATKIRGGATMVASCEVDFIVFARAVKKKKNQGSFRNVGSDLSLSAAYAQREFLAVPSLGMQ
jgi:hypothetical protein